jgi:VWFA-related protein
MIDRKYVLRIDCLEKVCGWTVSALLLVSLVQVAHGQANAGSQAPPSETPTASTNVDEVSLDLIVHDKRHKQILDLKPEDLAVTDNGVPVTLKGLHLVRGESNSDHTVTMVFDRFNGTTAKNAQNVAEKILKALPGKGYSFAVMDFSGRLRLIQSFTEDRDTIRQAVKVETDSSAVDNAPVVQLTFTNLAVNRGPEIRDPRTVRAEQAEKNLIAIVRTGADSSGNHVDVQARARCQMLLSALEGAQQIHQDQHAAPQLAGLLSIARSQQKLGSRKALIYFTQNMQMDSASKEMLNTIAGAANQAGVTIYVVDMDAMDVGGKYQIDSAIGAQNVAFSPAPQAVPGSGGRATQVPTEQAGPGGPTTTVGMAIDWTRQSDPHPFTEIKSPMADLAKNTGGAYLSAQDSIKKPLEQMVDDLTTYYQASYIPPIVEYDGSFRTIATKPLRNGLDIKTKTGYFAVASAADGSIRPFEVPLLKVLSLPQLPSDVKFQAKVLQFGELPDGNTSAVAVEVPLSELLVKKDARTGLFSAHVSIVAQIEDNSGKVVEHFSEDIAKRGALESVDNNEMEAITLQRHFVAIPGRYTLEAAVLDQLGEKFGAQRIPFEIPSVQNTPSLSEIVLVRKVDPFQEDDDLQEPMRYEKERITPNLSGDIPKTGKSISLFFIVHPDPKSKEPVTLQMSAGRNGRPGKLMPLPLHLENGSGTAPYLANFKSGLPPGDYEVQASITQGGKTAVRSLSFTVEGGDSSKEETAKASSPGPRGGSDGGVSAGLTNTGEGSTAGIGQLAITPMTNPVPAPSPEEIQALIAEARSRAVGYADSLPNFMCVEVTNRSYDPTGNGRWKHRDTIAELLRYRDKDETHTMLELNGKSSTVDRSAMANKNGAFSAGELGGVLSSVFSSKATADFQWMETDTLGTGTVQVFSYRVAQSNSSFSVVGMNDRQVIVAFHGIVYIDVATRNVRRISMIADDLPRDFPTQSTSITVDYGYVSINSHDYLMPLAAEMRLRQGRHVDILNTIEFRDYRRFGSNVRMVGGFTPVEKP